MKSIKVCLVGCNGRMGEQIKKIMIDKKNIYLTCGIDRKNTDKNIKNFSSKLDQKLLDKVDVVIDFSSPDLTEKIIEICIKAKKPLIIGTTGLSDENMNQIKKAGKHIPILQSFNMSIGIWMMIKAFDMFINKSGFDYQIEEIHHRHKKDAPSGTAILLKNKLEKKIKMKINDTVSIRGGGVFGVHKLFAISEEELLTIEHTALNRAVFAKGAVHAAEWIIDKKPAVYEFGDCI